MRVITTGRDDSLRTIAARYYDNRSIDGVVKLLLRVNPEIKDDRVMIGRNVALCLPDYCNETPGPVK